MKLKFLQLTGNEKRTFILHIIYSLLDGIVRGILIMNEFVFIKTLDGTDYQLSVLFQFSMVLFVFLIFFNEFLKRIQNKKLLLRLTALLTQLPLLLTLLFPDASRESMPGYYHYIFLGIFLVYYSGTLITYPTINLFLKNTYQHENFGKLYSYAETVKKIMLLLSTFFFGLVLDADQNLYKIMYLVMAICGTTSLFLLSNIPYKRAQKPPPKKTIMESVRGSIKNMIDIVKKNIPYRHFEIGFLLYGFAFMSTKSVISIFFAKGLDLNYTSIAFYNNAYNVLAIILLPLMGKVIGNMDPRNFAVRTFGALAMFMVFLIVTIIFPFHIEIGKFDLYYFLIIAMVFHGIFAATMSLLWYIGSAYFCKADEADIYQSIHLSLTGVRGLFAPIIGIFFYKIGGFGFSFALGAISLIVAIILQKWSVNKYKLKEE